MHTVHKGGLQAAASQRACMRCLKRSTLLRVHHAWAGGGGSWQSLMRQPGRMPGGVGTAGFAQRTHTRKLPTLTFSSLCPTHHRPIPSTNLQHGRGWVGAEHARPLAEHQPAVEEVFSGRRAPGCRHESVRVVVDHKALLDLQGAGGQAQGRRQGRGRFRGDQGSLGSNGASADTRWSSTSAMPNVPPLTLPRAP